MNKKYLLLLAACFCGWSAAPAAEPSAADDFHKNIQPLLTEYCSDCHADGANKGGVAFDEFKSDAALFTTNKLWLAVLKNTRAGLMPPQKKSRPSPKEQKRLENWIKYEAFGIDPKNPEAGRVTVRRLNRFEYRNTIRDLMGVEYDTETEFPPDDTGYGFDDIGDVLTLSPMLLEKYLDAAKSIIAQAVPTNSRVILEKIIPGVAFHRVDAHASVEGEPGPPSLAYHEKAAIAKRFHAERAGHYQIVLDLSAQEKYVDEQFDYNKCRLVFKVDGQARLSRDYIREEERTFHYELTQDWQPGDHELAFEMQPLTPDKPSIRSLTLRIDSVTVRGPLDEKYGVRPKNFERFFTQDPPKGNAARRVYAHALLGRFATKAFRRPADDETVNRLVTLAESLYQQPGKSFEAGIAHAMVAVLVSPRFLFREEDIESHHPAGTQLFIAEYALASRLSYFLWSSMPDDELFRLAGEGTLRKNLTAQVKRMLADTRSEALVQNFTGQWLQARDIETIAIDSKAVFGREIKPAPDIERIRNRFHELSKIPDEKLTVAEREELEKLRLGAAKRLSMRVELSEELRKALRREIDLYFAGIVHEDRSVMELLESNYTFLNHRLAKFYGLTNLDVTGTEFRRVTLPADSPRGGVLTMGGVLVVTSNPTRTSPVKRGLFILDNILGNPAPPPPANIPPLEDAEKATAGHEPTLQEALGIHRSQPLCNSCHSRMDPLGLAFENFNALGMWRSQEHEQTIDGSGKLITGELFQDVRELKHILVTNHQVEFYRTLTEKMLTYALGRGLEYYDVETVDQIVSSLQQSDGRFSALLTGIIESAPFQKRHNGSKVAQAEPSQQNDLK